MESSCLFFLFFILVLRTLLNYSKSLVSGNSARVLNALRKDFQRWTSDAACKRR